MWNWMAKKSNSFAFSPLEQICIEDPNHAWMMMFSFSLSVFVHRAKEITFLTLDYYKQNLCHQNYSSHLPYCSQIQFQCDEILRRYFFSLTSLFLMRHLIWTPPLIKCSVGNCDEIKFPKIRDYLHRFTEFITDSESGPKIFLYWNERRAKIRKF